MYGCSNHGWVAALVNGTEFHDFRRSLLLFMSSYGFDECVTLLCFSFTLFFVKYFFFLNYLTWRSVKLFCDYNGFMNLAKFAKQVAQDKAASSNMAYHLVVTSITSKVLSKCSVSPKIAMTTRTSKYKKFFRWCSYSTRKGHG